MLILFCFRTELDTFNVPGEYSKNKRYEKSVTQRYVKQESLKQEDNNKAGK
jgi:hypothetical protein